MKIVHITERAQNKPVTRSRIGNTNDMGVAWCFGATEHLPMLTSSVHDLFDVDAVICTMSKTKYASESRWLQLAYDFKAMYPARKLIIYQEAEGYWPQLRPWDEQKQFYELLRVTDLFLTHNETDIPLYKLMAGHGRVNWFPSVMDLSMIENIPRPGVWPPQKSVVVAAYHWRWGGIQAALTANACGYRVVLNKAGDFKDGRDEGLAEVFGLQMAQYIPQMDWRAWATELSKHWCYLHPMPGTAAGRDQISCAVIGLPIIGNHKSSSQQMLWPDLASDPEDIEHHKQLLQRLEDPAFYSRVVAGARARVHQFGLDEGLVMAKKLVCNWQWEWANL